MKVKIKHTFEGYPDGTDKSRTTFTAGHEVEVPDAFGKLIVDKGHADPVEHAATAGPAHSAFGVPHDKQG